MSNTSRFIKGFEPNNQSHVIWLSRMIDVAENMANPNQKLTLIDEINKNPMKIKLDTVEALEWPHIHFCLCGVYAKAVLRRKAWIPDV